MFKLFKKKEKHKFYLDEYDVWVILRKSNKYKLHDWQIWEKCFSMIDPVIGKQLEVMNIRTSQSILGTINWLPFGRMIWSEKNNIKWTSKYKTGDTKKDDLQFFGTEFWMPSWTICDKENIAPSIFMKIKSSENGLLNKFFDESLIIATKTNINIINEDLINNIFTEMNASCLIKGRRQWGRIYSENSYTDSLMDFSEYQILNKKNLSKLELKNSSDIFGDWIIVEE